MGLTVAEKLIAASLVDGEMKKGKRISIHISQTLTHDLTGVMTYLEFEAMGLKKVKTDLSVSYIDHNILQADYKNPDDHRYLMDIAQKFGIVCTKPASGICHQLHLERFAKPGKSLLGSDSGYSKCRRSRNAWHWRRRVRRSDGYGRRTVLY